MAEMLYVVEKTCPLCGQAFSTTRVRNKLQLIRQDTDFCAYYKDVNPYYYAIWVCPHCGYAAQDTYFGEPIPSAAAEKLRNFLSSRQVNVEFGGVRTREQAMATYKLALFYGDMTLALASRLAGLWMKLAWLYREAGLAAEELAALTRALEKYEQASVKERLPIGALTEVGLQFLLGELYRRTGRVDEAAIYLGRLVSDPRARAEKRIYELARECWQLTRNDKKAQEANQI
jgi:uncharacterized protein (DUF2225 family)